MPSIVEVSEVESRSFKMRLSNGRFPPIRDVPPVGRQIGRSGHVKIFSALPNGRS